MKVDVQGVVGPVTVKVETKSLPNKCFVALQSESVDAGDSLALVPVKSKVNEEKLSQVFQNVCQKRKASKNLSPDKVKHRRNRVVGRDIVLPKFTICVSPSIGQRSKQCLSRRRKKIGRNVRRSLDNLVEISVGEGGFLSSMDISTADVGMGGWPETAPMCHDYTFMECSRVCVGDLNELAGQIEKLRGHANSSKTFMNVHNFLFDCDLVDMGFKGSKFICSNGQLDYLKAKKKGGGCEVTMMVDMSKAYDKLVWDIIEQVLLRFSFCDYWVSLIPRYITSVRYNLLLSGRKVAKVCPRRGIRQGDPLSPYLFILAADVHSSMVKVHVDNLKGIKLVRGCPTLSHCFFVEDSIFFFLVEKVSCEMMKWILDAYCKASEIVDILGVENVAHPGKYLGLPVVWGKSKDEGLAFVVANAIPTFPMSCFKFPKKTCASLDCAIAKFWWGQKKEEGRIHWIALNKLIKPKFEGGLDFREFSWFNNAMLAKQGAKASWAWSSLLEGRDLLIKGLCWSIDVGDSINVWEDPWIPSAVGFKPLPRPLFAQGLDLTNRRDLLKWSFNSSGVYFVMSGYKLAISRKSNPMSFKPCSSFVVPKNLWSDISKLKIYPKVKNFVWRACWNALSKKENLFKKKCSHSPLCPICKIEVESADHMPFFYDCVNEIWRGSPLSRVIDIPYYSRMETCCAKVFGKFSILSPKLQTLAACLCWSIWKCRCSLIFEGKHVDLLAIVSSANSLLNEFLVANFNEGGHVPSSRASSDQVASWCPPEFDQLKVNVDGAFISSKASGIEIIFRDNYGSVVEGCCSPISVNSSLMCEAVAVREALQMAIVLHLSNMVIESYCKSLIDAANSDVALPDWRCALVLDDIGALKSNLSRVSFC
ncbi:reverse transcriptase [Senna tora]|uniref:Reverse transcriptase n=1 Tax=Senna tora TaxID=362788 RepID=A0A834WZS3_9FABA|nr:reverse transcriptase [Senna tora]